MIRYYHKDRFLGYGVGINPLTGSIVLVTDDNEYKAFHREQITHHVVGETVLDDRVKQPNRDKTEKYFELPYPLPLS